MRSCFKLNTDISKHEKTYKGVNSSKYPVNVQRTIFESDICLSFKFEKYKTVFVYTV